MKLNKLKAVMICGSGFALFGCGVNSVHYLKPSGYNTASDYAFAVIESSGCIGKIDGLFTSSGVKKVTKDGLEYVFEGDNLHCSQTSFKDLMANYCRSKGGESVQGGTWCGKNDTPLFYVGDLSTLERSTNQSDEQWFDIALRRGFISEREQKKEEQIAKDKAKIEEEELVRVMSRKIIANVGDSICRIDNDVVPYQYPSRVYYRGYVEAKADNKLKVRIFWHGGEGFIINDVTPNPLIWTENKGWFHC
ncbi:TPA: hypothetical protein ACRX4O_004545 [Klebsiella quasipneumoniae]